MTDMNIDEKGMAELMSKTPFLNPALISTIPVIAVEKCVDLNRVESDKEESTITIHIPDDEEPVNDSTIPVSTIEVKNLEFNGVESDTEESTMTIHILQSDSGASGELKEVFPQPQASPKTPKASELGNTGNYIGR